jgi:hypothetical protein
MGIQQAITTPTAESPTSPSTSVEQLGHGLSREWLLDRRIVVYTARDASRPVVDAWVETFKKDIVAWPADRPFLVMHDLSAKNIAATPYGRRRAQEMVDIRPDLKGRAAIVVANTFTMHLVELFLRNQKQHTPRLRRLFFSREKAFEWLKSALQV